MSESLLPKKLVERARQVIEANRKLERRVAVAESCTGGLVCAALTEIPGSSDVFEAGYITYSNASKIGELGVSSEVVETFGAVSVATAWAMARGALAALLMLVASGAVRAEPAPEAALVKPLVAAGPGAPHQEEAAAIAEHEVRDHLLEAGVALHRRAGLEAALGGDGRQVALCARPDDPPPAADAHDGSTRDDEDPLVGHPPCSSR